MSLHDRPDRTFHVGNDVWRVVYASDSTLIPFEHVTVFHGKVMEGGKYRVKIEWREWGSGKDSPECYHTYPTVLELERTHHHTLRAALLEALSNASKVQDENYKRYSQMHEHLTTMRNLYGELMNTGANAG